MKPSVPLIAAGLAGLVGFLAGCGESEAPPPSIQHLAEGLSMAEVTSAGSPAAARTTKRWSLAQDHAQWHKISGDEFPFFGVVNLEPREDGLRVGMTQDPESFRVGGIGIELEGLSLEDWETVILKARTSDRFAGVAMVYNYQDAGAFPRVDRFFDSSGEVPPLFNDGSTQSYAMPLRSRSADPAGDSPTELRSIALVFAAPGKAEVDILSVQLVPRGAAFIEDVGTRSVERGGTTRHTLFAHAPARLAFDAAGPGRLDFGLSVNRGDVVTYRVSSEDGEPLFEETIDDSENWLQRSVDLSHLDQDSRLVLEAHSEREGSVALWGAPVVSREAPTEFPNVVFYVIDGGDADLMSLYEYGRPTTPFLEELAQEGVLFTRAHSNATWTQPSTLSFLTSLQHSVLGGLRRGVHSTALPENAETMAQHFRRAGYQTSFFTSNPNAGRIIGTDQGVDTMHDTATEHHSTSSIELHQRFFDWREAYPGAPFWVHFQTTDVHEPNEPDPEFAERFVSRAERKQLDEWDEKIWQVALADFGTTSIQGFYDLALARAQVDRQGYFEARRGLYDETMLHQDHALEQFVAKLKARGEWENTLFVLGSDHGHPAGTFARFGRGLFDPQPEAWEGAMCDAYATRIPLLVIWPGQIEGGRRIEEPVSMIDVLPTMLELVGLPEPELMMGQSLAPLLRGEEMVPGPVILDEFRVDEQTGEMVGNIEIIDGRWGASLEVGPVPEGSDPNRGRHSVPAGGRWGAVHPWFADVPRLLLYDLEQDPFAKHSVHAEHPELVEHYRELLLEQWQAHRAMGQRFGDASEEAISPEQMEQLRALGYVR